MGGHVLGLLMIAALGCGTEFREVRAYQSVAVPERRYDITVWGTEPFRASSPHPYEAELVVSHGERRDTLSIDFTGEAPVLGAPLQLPALEAGQPVELYVVARFIGQGMLDPVMVGESGDVLTVLDLAGKVPSAPPPDTAAIAPRP